MSKRNFVFALGAIFLTLSFPSEAQQPARIPRIGFLFASSASANRPASKHFANGCASLAMSKEKTLSLSTDMQKGNPNGCPTLQPNWSRLKVDVIVTRPPGYP